MKDYELTITIDGESAKELFSVGPNDLKDFFLPELLNVDPEDIVRIRFREDLPAEDLLCSKVSVHSDNYYRDNVKR